MSKLSKVTRVQISPDLRAKLEAVRDSKLVREFVYSPELDAAIVEYYQIKNKVELAKALGISERRMRNRYRELTNVT